MRPTVSILLGSGFSIPEGIPGVKQLNERLSKIDESEILIHSDQSAIFLKGQSDPNRFTKRDERFFLQEFLEFYNSDILKKGETFHYETFYDFYSGYLNSRENKNAIEGFYKKFNEKHFNGQDGNRDCLNRIIDFNRSFNQLLASQLHKLKYFEDVSCSNYPPYDSFLGFLNELMKTHDIKVHSLNHDIFFDWLGRHSRIWQHFADGYKLEGSPFYGTVSYDFDHLNSKVHKEYYVKLERFVDKFDKPICLFKLHGSVFNTTVYVTQPKEEWVRLKDNYGVYQFYMEVKDEKTNEHKFEHLWDEAAPDFLTGTTTKTLSYTKDPYYKNLFKYFENNLLSSELLVVIGYGFQDPGINQYLEKYFLSMQKPMVIIDPYKPASTLLEKYPHTYIGKSVAQVTYPEYLNIVPKKVQQQ